MCPFKAALEEQCWDLFPVLARAFHVMTFWVKNTLVSEASTIADCKVLSHQLNQGMLPHLWNHHRVVSSLLEDVRAPFAQSLVGKCLVFVFPSDQPVV